MTDAHPKSPAARSAEAGIGRVCPFCGRREKNPGDWHFVRIGSSGTTQVECLGCGARGPACTTGTDKDGSDLLRALTLWNERHAEGGPLQDRQRRTVQ